MPCGESLTEKLRRLADESDLDVADLLFAAAEEIEDLQEENLSLEAEIDNLYIELSVLNSEVLAAEEACE